MYIAQFQYIVCNWQRISDAGCMLHVCSIHLHYVKYSEYFHSNFSFYCFLLSALIENRK